MSYCNSGDKVTVTYVFGDKQTSVFKTSQSPIEVATENYQDNSTSNFDANGFQITFNSPQGQYGTITAVVTDYSIEFYDFGAFHPYTGYYINLVRCGETSFPPITEGDKGAKMSDLNLTIDRTVKCPIVRSTSGLCEIKVLVGGKTIFSAHGKCPVTFDVACGDDCPEGFCKCKSLGYPGYCCLDCAVVASEIHSITQSLKIKNNGR
ncbi:hypothetical protein [Nostoc sp.]|uniref:hypothetical protein n=1 Tax=Nostoc sp. TaxID=1180 RepID=UPI002FF8C9B0